MFTFEEKKEYFIRECKSKKYLMKNLAEINDRLNRMAEILQTGYNNKNNAKMLEEEELIKERNSIEKRINYVDDIIASISDPQTRAIITDLWINKHSKVKVSLNHYLSERQIYTKAKKELKKVL